MFGSIGGPGDADEFEGPGGLGAVVAEGCDR